MPNSLTSPRAAAVAASPLVLLGAAALLAAFWELPGNTESDGPVASMASDVSSISVTTTSAAETGGDYLDYTHVFPPSAGLVNELTRAAVNESTRAAQFAEIP